METDMERDKILNQLRAMRVRTTENGCTEAEALAATAMFGAWMDKYGFQQADLQVEEKDQIGTQSYTSDERSFAAMTYVFGSVARYCDCKCWMYKSRGTFEFFGHEPDAIMATYLMTCFDRALQSGWREYRETGGLVPVDPSRPHGRMRAAVPVSQFASFAIGMMSRLSSRVDELKAERGRHVDEDTGRTGTSLVVCKAQDVQRAYLALNLKLRNIRGGRRKFDGAALGAGRAAGDRVQITTGIGQSRAAGYIN